MSRRQDVDAARTAQVVVVAFAFALMSVIVNAALVPADWLISSRAEVLAHRTRILPVRAPPKLRPTV